MGMAFVMFVILKMQTNELIFWFRAADNIIFLVHVINFKTPTINVGDNSVARKLKKKTHIKERLLDQAMVLFICVPFQNGNFSKRKEFAPRGSEFFPLRAVPYGMKNHFYHIR